MTSGAGKRSTGKYLTPLQINWIEVTKDLFVRRLAFPGYNYSIDA